MQSQCLGRTTPDCIARVRPTGTVVCAGIHMSDIPSFPYRLLWEERTIRSVANLTRQDAHDFLALAAEIPLTIHVHAVRAHGREPGARRPPRRPALRCCCSHSLERDRSIRALEHQGDQADQRPPRGLAKAFPSVARSPAWTSAPRTRPQRAKRREHLRRHGEFPTACELLARISSGEPSGAVSSRPAIAAVAKGAAHGLLSTRNGRSFWRIRDDRNM